MSDYFTNNHLQNQKIKSKIILILLILFSLLLTVASQIIKFYIKNNYPLIKEGVISDDLISINHFQNSKIFFNWLTIKEGIWEYFFITFLGVILLFLAICCFLSKNFFYHYQWLILFSGILGNWINRLWNQNKIIDYFTLNVNQIVAFNLEDLLIFFACCNFLLMGGWWLIKEIFYQKSKNERKRSL